MLFFYQNRDGNFTPLSGTKKTQYAGPEIRRFFEDENLQLAVHEELNVLKPENVEFCRELAGIDSSSYALQYEEIEEVCRLFNNSQFTDDQLERISLISYRTSSPQKNSICNQWDGEDDAFTIFSLRGIERLINLKSIDVECLMDNETDLSPLAALSSF
jgi:hypothetical protein